MTEGAQLERRELIGGAAMAAAAAFVGTAMPSASLATPRSTSATTGGAAMAHDFVTTRDGTEIFYKDWGPKDARPVVFHHGWPLSADDWDNQMMFFRLQGFRVIAHDRRGHGRSTQTDTGNEMDT